MKSSSAVCSGAVPSWKAGVAAVAVLAILSSSSSQAAPGDFDPTFGGGGFVRTNAGRGGHALANGVALQADGKIVVVGGAWTTAAVFQVARYDADGTLDTGFADQGVATTEFASDSNEAKAVAIDSTGRIVVAGSSGDLGDFALARYNTDGTLDNGFGTSGKVTTAVGGSTDRATAIAIQADGKIVVAGQSHNGVNAYRFAVVRYLANGALDTGFGAGGKVVFQFGASTEDVNAVAVDPATGRIVVAGGVFNPGNGVSDFAAARLLANGALDSSFSGDGKVTTSFGTTRDAEARSVAVQADGKILLAGGWVEYSATFPNPRVAAAFGVVRYAANGTLDTGFGVGGLVTTDVHPDATGETGHAVAIQVDGRIVVAGASSVGDTPYTGDITVLRYLASGALDSSFDGDGVAITDLSPSTMDVGTGLAIQNDGSLVVAGYSLSAIVQSDIAVVRYATNGALDPGFDGDGIVTTTIGPALDYAGAVALQGDNKVLVVGRTTLGSRDPNSVFAIARYGVDGQLDPAFGTAGIVTTDFSAGNDLSWARGIAVQGDGRIVVVGMSGNNLAIARYNPDGSLDGSFSGDGKATITNAGAFAVAIQPDGRIVVAGRSSSYSFLLVRYETDGTLDSSFGAGGIVTTPTGSSARGVALQSDGRIVVVGGSYGACELARYETDGSLDPTFDADGRVSASIGTSGSSTSGCVTVAIDGTRIVAAGSSYNGTNLDFSVLRYLGDGSLDTTFDGDGIVVSDWNPSASGTQNGDRLNSVSVDEDGRVLAVGSVAVGAYLNFAVARYASDGTLDVQFDGDGLALADFQAGDDELVGGVLQSNGQKLVVAGLTSTLRDLDLAVGRYLLTDCGDGVLQAGETCDDGNFVVGDGCDDNCTATGCGNGVVTSGEECDDGNTVDADACRTDCMQNVCGDAFLYPFVEFCDDGGLDNGDGCDDACRLESDCGFEPVEPASCAVAAKVQLQFRANPTDPGKSQLKWKWIAGEALAQAELGTPSVDTDYTLCVYDSSDGQPSLSTWAHVAPGSLWTDKNPRGWKYKDKLAVSDGVQSVSIKAGAAAKTKAMLVGRGAALRIPAPFSMEEFFEKDPSVIVQLLGPDGFCLTSDFPTAKRNDGSGFKASNP